jgi:hypothetical protein
MTSVTRKSGIPAEKKRITPANWLIEAALALVCLGLPCVLLLRLGLKLSWREVAIPLSLLAVLHVALVAALRYGARHKSIRITALIFGAYYVALFWMAAHYASRWHLHVGFEPGDVRSITLLIAVMVVGLILMPRRWIQHLSEIKCVRCHHFHEGRDCACGCRIDQFTYPNRTSGFP